VSVPAAVRFSQRDDRVRYSIPTWSSKGGTLRSARLNVVSPAPRELWSQVIKSSPEALAFHTPEWLDCICATGVYEDASLAYETVDDRRFILPLVRRKWLPTPLTTEASPPYG